MLFSRIMRKYKLSLGKRIYISMLLLLLVSFVITGLSTALQFNSQNTQYHADRLKRKERAVMSSIDYFLQQAAVAQNPDSIVLLVLTLKLQGRKHTGNHKGYQEQQNHGNVNALSE